MNIISFQLLDFKSLYRHQFSSASIFSMARSRSRSKGRNSQQDPSEPEDLTFSEACDMGLSFFSEAKRILYDGNSQLLSREIELQKKQAEFEADCAVHEDRVQNWRRAGELFADGVATRIKLNVGGQLFETSRMTLMSEEGTYFHSLLRSGKFEPDSDGTYFIDRDPRTFRYILNYLRDGVVVHMSKLDSLDRQVLLKDIDYFQIESLKHVALKIEADHRVQANPFFSVDACASEDNETLRKMFVQGIRRVLQEAKKAGRGPIFLSDLPGDFKALWKVPLTVQAAGEFDLTSFLFKWPRTFSLTSTSPGGIIVELANG